MNDNHYYPAEYRIIFPEFSIFLSYWIVNCIKYNKYIIHFLIFLIKIKLQSKKVKCLKISFLNSVKYICNFPTFTRCFFYFLFLLAVYFCTTACDRDYGAGGGIIIPIISPQLQFLTAFLDHRVTKSCKVTRTATKMWWPNRRKSHVYSSSFQIFSRPIRSDPSRQSRSQSPRSSVGAIVGLWDKAQKNARNSLHSIIIGSSTLEKRAIFKLLNDGALARSWKWYCSRELRP